MGGRSSCLGGGCAVEAAPPTARRDAPESAGCGLLVDGFHGDPNRGHSFWKYTESQRLATQRWDTHATAADFCTNHCLVKRHGDGKVEYKCLGHAGGTQATLASGQPAAKVQREAAQQVTPGSGQLVGGFHGDPARGNRFWKYSAGKPIVTPRWDTHAQAEEFCTNCRSITRHGNGVQEYQCLGHEREQPQERWHGPAQASVASGTLVGGFHGDPDRGNKFWQYPRGKPIVTPRWDTHAPAKEFCGNCRLITRQGNGVQEFQCLGHGTQSAEDSARAPEESAIAALQAMGHQRRIARWALRKAKGDIDAAAALAKCQPETLLREAEVYLEPYTLQRLPSDSLLDHWTEDGRGLIAGCPEYQGAADLICVSPELMCSSQSRRCLAFLNKRTGAAIPNFEVVASAVVQKAWSLRTDSTARRHIAEVPGLSRGNMFDGLKSLHASLSWEQPFLTKALAFLSETASPADLQLVAGLALRGAQECQARKVYAFHAILGYIPSAAACDGEPSASFPLGSDGEAGRPEVAGARRAILEVARAFIDDAKEDAFRTTFTEPTKLYLSAVGDHTMEGDVDVHGANTYLAVLVSCLGVQLNRLPFLGDETKGVADFLAAGIDDALILLWADENFGKVWESVPQLRSSLARPHSRVSARSFVFGGASPREVANAAVDPRGSSRLKKQLAKYLECFARFFSAPFLVPRLLSRLLSEEGRPEALQVLLDDLLQCEPHLSGGAGEEDVRFWLWDLEAFPAKLRMERAERLLQHAGVVLAPPPGL